MPFLKRVPHLGSAVCALSLALLPLAASSRAADTAGSKPAAAPLFPDEVVAKGKGFEVRSSELEDLVISTKAAAAAQNQKIPESYPGEIDARVLDRLILNKLALMLATPEDKAKGKENAEKFFDDTKKRALSEGSFRRQLIASGLTEQSFRARLEEQAVVEKVIDREVRAKVTVTPAQVKEFYFEGMDGQTLELQQTVDRLAKSGSNSVFYADAKKRLEQTKKDNLERLNRKEQVRGAHILIYTVDKTTQEALAPEVVTARKELMGKAVARLKNGEEFKTVAIDVSEDPQVKETGGEFIATRESPMAPELKDAIWKLGTNVLSDVVMTRYGMHVFKLSERTPAGKPPLDSIEKEIKEYLMNQAVQLQVPKFVETLRKDYAVEVLLPSARGAAKP